MLPFYCAALRLAALSALASAARVPLGNWLPPAGAPPAAEPLLPEAVAAVIALLPPVFVYTLGGPRGLRTARVWPPGGVHIASGHVVETLLLPGGELLLTRSIEDRADVWSMRSRHKVAAFGPLGRRRGLTRAFPDGGHVVGLCGMRQTPVFVIWSARSGVAVQRLDLARATDWTMDAGVTDFLAVRVLGSGDRVVTAASHRGHSVIVIWSAARGRPVHVLTHQGAVYTEASPCGGKVVTLWNRGLHMWDTSTGALESHIEMPVVFSRPIVEVSRGGARVFASMGQNISVWEGATGEWRGTLSMQGYIVDFALLPDDRRLAVLAGSSAALWDAESCTLLRTLSGVEVHSSAFAADVALSVAGDAVAMCATARYPGRRGYDDEEDFYSAAHDLHIKQVWDSASGRVLFKYRRREFDASGLFRGPSCSIASVAEQLLVNSAGP